MDISETQSGAMAQPDTHNERGGENNVRFMGFDVHGPVFQLSALIAIVSSALVLAMPDQAASVLLDLRNNIMSGFDWFFSLSVSLITIFIVALAFSPLGKMRLGGRDATAEFGYVSWICMLFSAGVGIGMTFYGAAEP
ncbi:MAG TPA: glycine/betaine ABC transporter, partial [Rhodobiaceae bacterium]|nr:glycine/betaine ABC transporter [Rhodobiaceae bacterium]